MIKNDRRKNSNDGSGDRKTSAAGHENARGAAVLPAVPSEQETIAALESGPPTIPTISESPPADEGAQETPSPHESVAKAASRTRIEAVLRACGYRRLGDRGAWQRKEPVALSADQLSLLRNVATSHLALYGMSATCLNVGPATNHGERLVINPTGTSVLGRTMEAIARRFGAACGVDLAAPLHVSGRLNRGRGGESNIVFLPWSAILDPDRPVDLHDPTYGHELIHAMQYGVFDSGAESYETGRIQYYNQFKRSLWSLCGDTLISEKRAHSFDIRRALSTIHKFAELNDASRSELAHAICQLLAGCYILRTEENQIAKSAAASLELFQRGGPICYLAPKTSEDVGWISWVVGYDDRQVSSVFFETHARTAADAAKVAVSHMHMAITACLSGTSAVFRVLSQMDGIPRAAIDRRDLSGVSDEKLRNIIDFIRRESPAILQSLRMPRIEQTARIVDCTSELPSVPQSDSEWVAANSRYIAQLLNDSSPRGLELLAAMWQAGRKFDVELAGPVVDRLQQLTPCIRLANDEVFDSVYPNCIAVLLTAGRIAEAHDVRNKVVAKATYIPARLFNNIAWCFHEAGVNNVELAALAWKALQNKLDYDSSPIKLGDIVDTFLAISFAVSGEQGSAALTKCRALVEKLRGETKLDKASEIESEMVRYLKHDLLTISATPGQ